MKFLSFFSILLTIQIVFADDQLQLPPLPESWLLPITDILTGIKMDPWLKDVIFKAPLRVKPNQHWNALVESTWIGPPLVDSSLLNYVQLEFNPLNSQYDEDWSGDKILTVSSYDMQTNRMIFTPRDNHTFMKAPGNKVGVYNNMYFALKIDDDKLLNMNIHVNTRSGRDVEVTCSDGVFCNGEERFVRGQCVAAKRLPCLDMMDDPCKSYECIEEKKQCAMKPIGGDQCKTCKSDTEASTETNSTALCIMSNYECGWTENKDLYCGKCPLSDQICSKNKCISKSSLGEGSCIQPYQLYNQSLVIPDEGIPEFVIYGDLSSPIYTDNVIPVCNPSPVVDIVYEFRIASPHLMGMDIQMQKADGTNHVMDTVLTLTDENCESFELYSLCGDDSSPPGGMSSRIFGYLNNGTYKVIATAFSNVEANICPFRLIVKFYPRCIPQCEGNRKCGSDGCGGVCGTCEAGAECVEDIGECRANPCLPKCTLVEKNETIARTCGADSCGSVCGSCDVKNAEMCEFSTGTCKKVPLCNNFIPECTGSPPPAFEYPFCGHDCEWHDMNDELGDLMPNDEELVVPSIVFDWRFISNRSCAVVEGCLRKNGYRLLLRFDTYVHNVGRVNMNPPSPLVSPNLFQYSPCHAHFHLEGFAAFNLYDINSVAVIKGGKRGYCMEDTVQTHFGEHIPCQNKYDCTNQGIQPGWADLYPNVLDCQWMDVTDIVKDRWYIYEICSNIGRKLVEAAHTNDCKRFPVYIPDIPIRFDNAGMNYNDLLAALNITDMPVISPEPGAELENLYQDEGCRSEL